MSNWRQLTRCWDQRTSCRATSSRPDLLRRGGVRVLQIMLPQQIFPVVVAVRRTDDDVDVLWIRSVGILGVGLEVRGHLVVELDQDYRTVNTVVEDSTIVGLAHPREPGLVE